MTTRYPNRVSCPNCGSEEHIIAKDGNRRCRQCGVIFRPQEEQGKEA